MRVLVNFMNRDGWSHHCVAPDCQTLVSQWITVRSEATLLRLLNASGATPGFEIEMTTAVPATLRSQSAIKTMTLCLGTYVVSTQ
jgi:hypothetical protein